MDIQVIYFHDVLRVVSVTNVPNVIPRTLDVRGPDLKNAVQVEINDVEAPEFAVMSKNRLLVRVPTNQENEHIRTLAVMSGSFTKTDRSLLKFTLGNQPRQVSGLQKLMQSFVLYLLRSPGTDVWYPNSGGGIQKIIGSSFSRSNVGGVTATFSTAVSRTRTQLMSLQAVNTRLDASEKLAAANVRSAVFNKNQTALLARVELINQAGERAIVGLEL